MSDMPSHTFKIADLFSKYQDIQHHKGVTFVITKNREGDLPRVIGNRVIDVCNLISKTKTSRGIYNGLLRIFEGTKVQVGEMYEPKHNKKGFFIRNGFMKKAHYLIERP